MKVKEESEKVGLKLNIQKTKIMASGPITSWEMDGETVETMSDFIFLGSKITAESPLDCREIQSVHPKDQSWVFIGRTDVEAETPVLWPPHAESWLVGKDPDAGRDWGQEEKGMTEDEMAGWHHPLDGHEFEWTPGVCDGQGGLVFCDSRGRKESDTTEWLNWTELYGGLSEKYSIFGNLQLELNEDIKPICQFFSTHACHTHTHTLCHTTPYHTKFNKKEKSWLPQFPFFRLNLPYKGSR